MRNLLILIVLCLSGCSIHQVPVQQGNVFDKKMIAELKPGMTKARVKEILGEAVLRDTFNNQRWQYVYTNNDGDGHLSRHRLVIEFKNDRLATISTDMA